MAAAVPFFYSFKNDWFLLCNFGVMEALYKLLNRTSMLSPKVIWMQVFRNPALKTWVINELIQKDQLTAKGVDEDGDLIGLYSEWTEMLNPQKVAGTHYTLNDTGAFYRSMFIRVGFDFIEIDADPIKTDENGEQTDLFKKYGIGIIGLTEESKAKLASRLRTEYAKERDKILFRN